MSQFKYLGTTVTNQNLFQEEIMRRLNFGNACYHSVQYLSSSRMQFKNLNMQDYYFACGSVLVWSLVPDIRGGTDCGWLGTGCWGGYLGRRGMKWQEGREHCITRSFVNFTLCQYNLNDQVEEDEMSGACSLSGGRRGTHMLLVGKSEG
jgi:hypothetical protein